MKNRVIRLLLIPSGIALLLSLAGAAKVELVLFSLIGLGFGVLLCFSEIDRYIPVNRVEYIVGIILAAILYWINSRYFFHACLASSAMKIFLGLVGFPFFAYIIVVVIAWLVQSCKILKPKKLLQMLKGKISLGLFLRKSSAVIINLAIAASAGTLLLFAVYCLPVDTIGLHVRSSAATIQGEGTYPSLYSWCQSQLDNFTDSIMLLEAADETDAPALEKAMLVYHSSIDDFSPAETLVAHYVQNKDFATTTSYARYWHGYLVFLKPLLELFDYHTIRIINGIVQLGVLLLVCILMKRRGLKSYIIPYLLCYLTLMPMVLARSLQYSACYYVFTAGVITLLLLTDNVRSKFAYLVFLNIGILTAYFDFLTYPMATFGIPAVIYIAQSKTDSLEEKLGGTARNGALWCLGYGGMWGAKWLIASVATEEKVLVDALGTVTTRTSTVSYDGTQYSILGCEIANYTCFIKTPVTILVIMFCLYVLCKCTQRGNLQSENMIVTSLPYGMLSFAPMVWYAFATNHSTIHYWFTNKACIVTLAAILFGITELSQKLCIRQHRTNVSADSYGSSSPEIRL